MKLQLLISVFLLPIFLSNTIAQDNFAGEDKYIFREDSIMIGPLISNPEVCYYWEPKELMSDNTIPNPKVKVDKTTTFTCTITGKDFSFSKTASIIVHFVKVEKIEGLENSVCEGKNITMRARLTDDIPLPKGWALGWKSINATLGNQLGQFTTAIFREPDMYCKPVRCWIIGGLDTAKKCAIVVGLTVKLADTINAICDGSRVPLYIQTYPDGASPLNMNCFTDFELHAEIAEPSYGNPIGTTNLTFTALTTDFKSEIENARWYSNNSSHCNITSTYNIWASAKTLDGSKVNSEYLTITVNADFTCVFGTAPCCVQVFEGEPEITTEQLGPNQWIAHFGNGTFKRNIIPNPIEIFTLNTSQFYDLTFAEESYHNRQQMGLVPSLYENIYKPENIFIELNSRQSETQAQTSEVARIAAIQLFEICKYNEVLRSVNFSKTKLFRCSVEYDAKQFVNNDYLFGWQCAYMPSCKDLEGDF